MILVQSRRRRLNGNSIILLLISIVFVFSSCVTKKKVIATPEKEPVEQGTQRVYNPETGKYELVKEAKVDTVRWTEVSESSFPPITSETEEVVTNTKKDVYNVSYFIPFKAASYSYSSSSMDGRTSKFVNYYAGVKLALSQLEQEGIFLNTYVHDTEASTGTIESLLNRSSSKQADAIIGPYDKSGLQATAEFSKEQKIPLVSPWRPSSRVSSENPFLIQLNPSLTSHCQAITQHVLENFSPDQVVLIARNRAKDRGRFRYFQDANQTYSGIGAEPFKEFLIQDETMSLEDTDLTELILKNKATVFIVPYYARSEEEFVHSFLGRLSFFKGDETVYVYGLPHWKDYSKINYDWFESLNIRMSSSNNIDGEAANIVSFKTNFYNVYGNIPNEDAYEGYDHTMYVGRKLAKHGKDFPFYLDTEDDDLLQTSFRFQKVGKYSDDFKQYDYLENKKLYIIEFRDYKFKVAP